MLVPLKWLKDFVDVDFSIRILANRLTMSGLSVTSIHKPEGVADRVLEMEVTSNRADCLSILGVAREVGVIARKRLCAPKEGLKEESTAISKWVQVKVQDEKGCPRYCARVIRGIRVKQSPKWLRDRLQSVGIRPINHIVDVTNYCLMEYGQPLHAFDLDRLEGAEIIVRKAKSGEKIVTLDGVERALDSETLVIADQKRPVALAGVMGGAGSLVAKKTQNILIESAYFHPGLIRQTTQKYRLNSDSSYRFERGVDLNQVSQAANRACHLIQQISEGKVARGLVDIGRKKARPRRTSLWPKHLKSLLGVEVPRKRIEEILNGLGISILKREKDRLWLLIPSWRSDLARPIDMMEEIARVWGYDRIPSSLPQVRVDQPSRSVQEGRLWRIRERMVSAGLSEVMNYALRGQDLFERVRHSQPQAIHITNPRSREQECLRPTLVAGMLEAAAFQTRHSQTDFALFEIGKAYHSSGKGKLPREPLVLGIVLSGSPPANWADKPRAYDIFNLKGLFEGVGEIAGGVLEFEHCQGNRLFLPGSGFRVTRGREEIGQLGEVDPALLSQFDIHQTLWVGELYLDSFLMEEGKSTGLVQKIQTPSHFPSIRYDLSMVASQDLQAAGFMDQARSLAKEALSQAGLKVAMTVSLWDLYQGRNIPPGKRSLTFAFSYQPLQRTLTEIELRQVHDGVCASLAKAFDFDIRR